MDEFIKALKSLKTIAEQVDAGKATVTYERQDVINGWHYAITVQRPNFQPKQGDWKLNIASEVREQSPMLNGIIYLS